MMDCKGCADEVQCTLSQWGSVAMDECPCKDCIVKIICNVACYKLNDHYQECMDAHNKK